MVAYGLLTAGYVALVWALPFFPAQDGPSHIYNLAILHDLINGGGNFGRFFTYELHAVPNLGFYLVAYPLLTLFTPFVAEKVFLTVYLVALAGVFPYMARTFGKPPFPLSYLLFPVMLNYTLLMGFYSYCISIPLFLFAFCLAWRTRNSSTLFRIFCLNVAGIVLYYSHMIGFQIFLLSLVAIVMADSTGIGERAGKLLKLLFLLAPVLANFLMYMAREHTNVQQISYLTSLKDLLGLFSDLLCFSTVYFSKWQIVPSAIMTFIVILMVMASARDLREKLRRGEAAEPAEKTLLYLALTLLGLYLFAPFRFGEGSFFNQRFPWVILLVLLPALKIPDSTFFSRYARPALATPAVLFLAVNAGVFARESGRVEKYLSGLQAGLPRHAAIMAYKPGIPRLRVDALLHASSYYGVCNGCVDLGNYETTVHFFPVRVKGRAAAIPPLEQIERNPASIDWGRYPDVKYLVGWGVDGPGATLLADHYEPFWRNEELSLWRRR